MNGYICTYKGKTIEIYAETIYLAQVKAAAQFKARKTWEVDVYLAEIDGKPVEHTATF